MESPTPPSDRVGETIGGRYALRRLIGVGGYSAVYEAMHTVTGRVVALKLLHPHLLLHQEIIDRFLLEARAMANVRHEGIVQVLDAGTDDPTSVYIVLELLEGESMEALLQRQQTIPWPKAALYCAQVLDALAVAHQRSIVHRDIKPGNIFLALTPDGEIHARLLDFGIALVAHQKRITGAGMLLGTPEYMSPEQCLALPVGPETDLWAVGIVLWECLTGRTPFLSESATTTLLRITSTTAPSIRDHVPELPAAMVALIDRALERDIEKRWRSADEMRDALLRVLRRQGGPEGIAAARMAARSSSRLQAIQVSAKQHPSPEPEVIDWSAVVGEHRSGAPGTPLTAVVSGGPGARPPAPPETRFEGASHSSSLPPEAPSLRPPSRKSSPPPPAVLSEGDTREPLQLHAAPSKHPLPPQSQRPDEATRNAQPTEPTLRRTKLEFELSAKAPAIESPAALPSPPAEPFVLPELTPEERAARSFTGNRATFQPPPSHAALRARTALYAAVAAGGLAAVGATVLALKPQPLPQVAAQETPLSLTVPGVPRMSPSWALTEIFATPPLSPSTDDAAEFARHATIGTTVSAVQRVVASCVPASDGATLVVRTLTVGAQRRVASNVVACAGHDLGVLADVTGDGVEDVISVGAVPDTLVWIDSVTLHPVHTVPIRGVRGVTVGALGRAPDEPMVVVFVEAAGPTQPTELRAIGAQSRVERWRRTGNGSYARLGHPDELGLATGRDVDNDGVDDIVAGTGPVLGAPDDTRCIRLLSGIDGRDLWNAPFCRALPHTNQSLALGPDVNGDGHADVAAGVSHPPEGEAPVVILSGADGSVLRRVMTPAGTQRFGASVALGEDMDGDRHPNLVVASTRAVYLFDATTGTLQSTIPLEGTTGVPPRVQVVPSRPGEHDTGVMIASAPEGIRVFAHVATGP